MGFSRALCVGIIGVTAVFSGVPRAKGDVNDELRGINQEIREKKQLIRKTVKVETKVSSELDSIHKKLKEKEQNLASLGRELLGVEATITRTRIEIVSVQGDAEKKRVQIQKRLSSLYKAGELGTVRMFFASDSFPQMTENVRYMNAVVQNDKRLFSEYQSRLKLLASLKENLEADAARKERIKKNIEAKKHEIEEEHHKKTEYLTKVRQDKKSYLESLKELEANARRLQAMVQKLEARNRKVYTEKKSTVGQEPALPPVPDKGFASQKGRLVYPVKGDIVDRFGRHKHPEFNSFTVSNGISISSSQGSDIRSVYDGQVIFANYFKGYGNMVIVDHGGSYFTLYAHASKIVKPVGSTVTRNDVIARVGDTDSSRGPLLYFEIRYQGKPIDPGPWFR